MNYDVIIRKPTNSKAVSSKKIFLFYVGNEKEKDIIELVSNDLDQKTISSERSNDKKPTRSYSRLVSLNTFCTRNMSASRLPQSFRPGQDEKDLGTGIVVNKNMAIQGSSRRIGLFTNKQRSVAVMTF